jgi:hypothetical protein
LSDHLAATQDNLAPSADAFSGAGGIDIDARRNSCGKESLIFFHLYTFIIRVKGDFEFFH